MTLPFWEYYWANWRKLNPESSANFENLSMLIFQYSILLILPFLMFTNTMNYRTTFFQKEVFLEHSTYLSTSIRNLEAILIGAFYPIRIKILLLINLEKPTRNKLERTNSKLAKIFCYVDNNQGAFCCCCCCCCFSLAGAKDPRGILA